MPLNKGTRRVLLRGSSAVAPSTLLNGLVSWWELDEASGTRFDAHASNDLSDNNTVGQAAGKVSNAADFVAAQSEYLSHAGSPFSLGDASFTITAWIYTNAVGTSRWVLGKDGEGNSEYSIRFDGSTNRIQWQVSPDGAADVIVTATSFGALSAATFYFVAVGHDADADETWVSINDGAVDTTAHAGGVNQGARAFVLGARSTPSNYWDGRLDNVTFHSRRLTASELTELFNSNNGIPYPG